MDLLGGRDSFFDQSSLGKDVGEALGEGEGAKLGVYVKLVICTQPDMFTVGVASIVGEPSYSFFCADIKASMAANKDILSIL